MIFFGVNKEYAFEGPYTLGGWQPLERPGVYAVMYRQSGRRERYPVIYVGESGNFAAEGFPFRHPRSPCWMQRVPSRWKLAVAYLILEGSTPSVRSALASSLVDIYNPICNEYPGPQ